MVLEYPDDPACSYLDRQYMLGDSLLVAPVFRNDSLAEYYLPVGRWTDLLSNEVLMGGRWIRRPLGFMQIPLFVRENSIVPLSTDESDPSWLLNDELTLHLFRISEKAQVAIKVHSSDGAGASSFTCQRNGSDYVLTCDGRATNVRACFRDWSRSAALIANGKILDESSQGVLVRWLDTTKPLEVRGATKPTPQIEHLRATASRDKLRA
jgi:alpha-D-xyloside xylohydrolase